MLIKILSQKHPSYKAKSMASLQALYEGGDSWQAKDWIPQNYAEDPDLYEDRLSRALYTNHAGPILDLMASWLFETEPSVADASPQVARLLDDADGKGTPSSAFFRETFVSALVKKSAFVWVNLPSREGLEVASRLEEEQLGLDQAFLVNLDAAQVIDWEEDSRGALSWVMVHDVLEQRPNPLQGSRTKVWRWTLIDRERIRRWEWSPPASSPKAFPEDGDSAAQTADVEHGMGMLPVSRYELKPGLWAMQKLKAPATAYLQTDNDLRWALHKAAHALLVIATDPNEVQENETPVVGPGYSMEISSSGRMEYIEPPGQSFETMRNQKKDSKDDMFRVVHQMAMSSDSGDSMRQLSGASKSRDMESLQIIMSDYSRTMLDFIRAVFDMVKSLSGDSSPTVVDGLNSWKRRTLAEFLEAAVLSVGAQTMSATFAREVSKKQADLLLSEDVDGPTMDKIHSEIDSAEPFGANLSSLGKTLGDDVAQGLGVGSATAPGGRAASTEQKDQSKAQPANKGGTGRST